MTKYKLVLPSIGEGIIEATITKWLKKEGDLVNENDSIVQIATDKVDSDILSEKCGILRKICKQVNEIVQVGEVIAEIETDKVYKNINSPSKNYINNNQEFKNENKNSSFISDDISTLEKKYETLNNLNSIFLSPLVKSIINEENISNQELASIKGSGMEGRITKGDIVKFLKQRNSLTNKNLQVQNDNFNKLSSSFFTEITSSSISISPGDEVIEMDRMRSLISNYMVESKKISPHVTSFIEADVTNLVLWKKKNSIIFIEKYYEKLTFTPLFIYAIMRAIKDFPMINISVVDNKIIKKKNINIGIATALPSGNLIVPVIKNADKLNIIDLVKKVNNLVKRARNNKLNLNDITEGTYTITNIGTFGNLMGTPIINQPQVAIMAVGVIQKKVSVLETKTGDQIGIRYKMYLSHTYDHRVVDGALGGVFLKRVADYLENFNLKKEI